MRVQKGFTVSNGYGGGLIVWEGYGGPWYYKRPTINSENNVNAIANFILEYDVDKVTNLNLQITKKTFILQLVPVQIITRTLHLNFEKSIKYGFELSSVFSKPLVLTVNRKQEFTETETAPIAYESEITEVSTYIEDTTLEVKYRDSFTLTPIIVKDVGKWQA